MGIYARIGICLTVLSLVSSCDEVVSESRAAESPVTQLKTDAGTSVTVAAGKCSSALAVQRLDKWNNPAAVSTATTVSLAATGATQFYSDAACKTAITQVAIGKWYYTVNVYIRSESVGAKTLTFSASNLTSVTSTATVVPSDASKLAFESHPGSTFSGSVLAPSVSVSVRDAYGNMVNTGTQSIALKLVGGTNGTTLSGTKTKAAVSGLAGFSDLSVTGAGTGLQLQASSAGLASATGQAFNITAPAPSPSPSPSATPSPSPVPSSSPVANNLIPDGGFESGLSGFYAQNTTDSATRITDFPLAGTASLRVNLKSWGSNVWWVKSMSGVTGTTLTVAATVRSEVTTSNSPMQVCATAMYQGASAMIQKCANAPAAAGTSQLVTAALALDSTRAIQSVNVRLTLDGATATTHTVDNISLVLSGTGTTPTPTPTATATPAPTATVTPTPTITVTPTATPSPSPTATPSPSPSPLPPASGSKISAAWANDGGDKVTQDELRANRSPASVQNSLWDGNRIRLFAGRNEVVAFNLVLEAATQAASDVEVQFNELSGPSGSKITGQAASGDGVFNWVGRNIELFHVRYLQIKGLSRLSYETYDERHIPKRFQRPSSNGVGTGTWNDRPDHDKYYPDIAVPMEIVNRFTIGAGNNQSIWSDIYVPKTATPGLYTGTIRILEAGAVSREIPVELTVRSFTLPDSPNAKTMVYLGYQDLGQRYTGVSWPNANSSEDQTIRRVRDRHFMMAHRHKLQVIDNDPGATASPGDRPRDEWMSRLSGSLFSTANGYDGPGVNTSNGVYSIGTYSQWSWKGQNEAAMRTHTDAWENWFTNNYPNVDRFLYLIDESTNYAQIEQWSQWINNNPGPGRGLKSFATMDVMHARQHTPSLDIAASWFSVAPASMQAAVDQLVNDPNKGFMIYNGKRPAAGSFATEDDGVALRTLPWIQKKKKLSRWFFWESTYYNDYQGGRGMTNVFKTAQTFGGATTMNNISGQTGWNSSNGDGVLFYPGTDRYFAAESLALQGPVASLRLKHWRRGIQDVDYITLASQIDPARTQAIINQMMPKALWEYGVTDANDPTWTRTDISWSTNPDVWENARAQLADIIEGR